MPTVYFKHRNIVLLSLISFAIACGPTYQSVRVHVPHQTKAAQLQIEATLPEEINGDTFNTQIDTSYSLTDNFIVSGGLIYQTFESSGIDERYAGIHLGAGYHLPINDWVRSTSLAGVGLQTWSWDEDQSNLDEDYSWIRQFRCLHRSPICSNQPNFWQQTNQCQCVTEDRDPNFSVQEHSWCAGNRVCGGSTHRI